MPHPAHSSATKITIKSDEAHSDVDITITSQAVDDTIEAICEQGCQFVSQLLLRNRQDRPLPELEGFSPEQKQQILLGLTDIMSVYSGSCQVDKS